MLNIIFPKAKMLFIRVVTHFFLFEKYNFFVHVPFKLSKKNCLPFCSVFFS